MSRNKEKQNAVPAEEEEKVKETTPEEGAEEAAAKTEELGGEIERLTQENAELTDRLLRSSAEFDNFRKRTQKEKQELAGYAKALCMKELLEVVDNFERALGTECKDADYKKGMEMTFTLLLDAMKKQGVEEIKALGCTFDPEIHNAIKQVEDESFESNTVCQVLQKGYSLEGRVIRHSMVVVANP